MLNALVYKELRESAGAAALGFAGLAVFSLACIGINPLGLFFPGNGSYSSGAIPFVADSFEGNYRTAVGLFAIALGFKQALGDLFHEAHLFWLHRPIPRRSIYLVKIAVGLTIYLTLALAPVLVYSLRAASSGTHASPFEWSMTTAAWVSWPAVSLVYLGALWSGVRPAAWFGTRLAPVAAAVALAFWVAQLPLLWGFALTAAIGAMFVTVIVFTVETRDFA